MRADYAGAKASRYRRRRTGISLAGAGADYHYRSENDFLKLLEYARDFDRNDMVVGQVIDRATSNVVQQGMLPEPQTGDKGADLELWNRWQEWSGDPDQCDSMGEHSFPQMERLVSRAVDVDGDMVGLTLSEGSLQLVESHRIRTPRGTKRNVVHGVLLDEMRRRQQYWITKDDSDPSQPLQKVSDVQPYDVRDTEGNRQVLHVYNPKRASQTRGITAFAPLFDAIGMHDDLEFANLVKAQVVTCFAIFRKRTADWTPPEGSPQRGSRTSDTYSDGSSRRVEGIAPGMEVAGEVGEELSGFSPQIPGEGFFPQVKLILSFIGINVGLPLIMVLMDAGESNFSGWRGAIEMARMGFRDKQHQVLIPRFHRPVWRWKVRGWLAEDAALRKVAALGTVQIFRHQWCPPTWPYIDPYKDTAARVLRERTGQTSPRRLHAEEGNDFETIALETIADNAYRIVRAKRMATKINARFDDGQPVHWRELLSLPTPEGVTLALPAVEEQQPQTAGVAA